MWAHRPAGLAAAPAVADSAALPQDPEEHPHLPDKAGPAARAAASADLAEVAEHRA